MFTLHSEDDTGVKACTQSETQTSGQLHPECRGRCFCVGQGSYCTVPCRKISSRITFARCLALSPTLKGRRRTLNRRSREKVAHTHESRTHAREAMLSLAVVQLFSTCCGNSECFSQGTSHSAVVFQGKNPGAWNNGFLVSVEFCVVGLQPVYLRRALCRDGTRGAFECAS